MERYDCVVVGSGINSLVCAALLSIRGRRVLVLERNSVAGGCIRSDPGLRTGFMHDPMSLVYPLFLTSPGYAALREPLADAGVEFSGNDTPTGVLTPDGRSLILRTDRAANVDTFEAIAAGDGRAYEHSMRFVEQHQELIFGLLGGDFWRLSTAGTVARACWRQGVGGVSGFVSESLQSSRAWLTQNFSSDLIQALLAPWILHGFSGPDSALSGLINRLIPFTLEMVGNPVVVGGSYRLVRAFCHVIESRGGKVLLDAHVERIVTENGVATGVRLEDGRSFSAARAVICNVTPTQLYGNLLDREATGDRVAKDASRFRYGRGDMQILLSLNAVPQWPDPEMRNAVMFHVSAGLNAVSRAVNEADRGLLPDEATIVVAQPVAVDPSRAPDGHWILWIQLQEVPRNIKGDARGELEIPAGGEWTEAIRERYADRIVDRLCKLAPNLGSSILARHVLSPADLEGMNINLVGGDPYSGECSLDQYLLWRPFASVRNHGTPVKRLYHIGASTHPGPGLSGISGYLVANAIGGAR